MSANDRYLRIAVVHGVAFMRPKFPTAAVSIGRQASDFDLEVGSILAAGSPAAQVDSGRPDPIAGSRQKYDIFLH